MKLVKQRRKHDAENNSNFFLSFPLSASFKRFFTEIHNEPALYTHFDPLPQKINYEEFFSLQDKTKTFTFTCVMKLTHFSQASSWETRIRMGSSLINREVACFALKRGVPDGTMVRVRILAKTHCQALIEQALEGLLLRIYQINEENKPSEQ